MLLTQVNLSANRIAATTLAIALSLTPIAAEAVAQDQPDAPLPFAFSDAALEARFLAGARLEQAGEHLEAARTWEALASELPEEAHLRWRIARAYYQHARSLPLEDKDERLAYFTDTLEWAKKGATLDASCAECFLYEFVGMSRVATTRGIFSSARHAKEMAGLLDRALELGPTHTDADWNSELANLYYAAGVFYRSLPTSSIVSWGIGVKGDRKRSIEYLRKANAITARRIDYRIELGASLLCAGTEASDDELIAEGRRVLEEIDSMALIQPSDALDQQAAPLLAADPDQACDYSRESILASE
jgi:tetratricopeptide (TPR) repeat protein